MDAPQLPEAEASAEPLGGEPTGQASAFRRALDAQETPSEHSRALVPTGPHDITAPLNLDVLRILLASTKTVTPHTSDIPSGLNAATSEGSVFPPPTALAIPTPPTSPVPVGTPSASGPTVVMPSVSAPALRIPTTIAATDAAEPTTALATTTFAGVPAVPGPAAVTLPAVGGARGDGPPPPEPPPSPRHNAKPSRLPTAVWISALLAAAAGAALVLLDTGHSGDPLAPTAMPTRAAAHSPSPHAAPAAKPSPKPSPTPSPTPSRPSPSPSHSPSASPTPTPSRPSASPTPSVVASFPAIYWTNNADPRVADIQRRLAQLNYLMLARNNNVYVDGSRTLSQSDWHPQADPVGFYQNATQLAIEAFKFDYLQHGQGGTPNPGCDTQTYQALVNATS